ncbi:MAG: hypothetical protein JNL28_08795 [Planctomycetes bacterium]|nr:hypothetical protein [Planctomycetota bacterium]
MNSLSIPVLNALSAREARPAPVGRSTAQLSILALGCGILVAAAGCRGPAVVEAQAAAAAEEARVQRAVDDRLRAIFPEVQGELTRAAILRALLAGGAEESGTDDVPAAAILSIRRGDYDLARGQLGELVTAEEVAKAREFLARDDQRAAVLVLDHAVATAPDSAELRLMRGEAELALAQQTGDLEFARRALADFQEAARLRPGARAALGASRAARVLGDADEALTRAREGIEALAGADLALPGDATPERVWAEAALASGSRSENSGLERETRTALYSAIARAPEDPWAWRQLAHAEFARGDAQSAQQISGRGLALFPEDAVLHATLASALYKSSGREGIIAEYERLAARNPRSARAHWTLGRERLEAALDALAAGKPDARAFRAAEADFARCKALADASKDALAAECAEESAFCRTGLGWSLLASGDLDGARDAFLSVDDAAKGRLSADRAPRLESGLTGLALVGTQYVARKNTRDAAGIVALEKAARVFDYLHEYERSNARFAALAAESNRDAAIAIEIDARALTSAGKIDEANRRLARARELMEKALAAYRTAITLAPDDARILRDAGQVLTNYLQRDAETARGWLERSVLLGKTRAERIAAERTAAGAGEAARKFARELEEVESLLSDAYQILGVLDLTLKGDPVAARAWFEKCLATGPDPSEEVRGPSGWLARATDAIESKRDTRVRDESRWAAPVTAAAKKP